LSSDGFFGIHILQNSISTGENRSSRSSVLSAQKFILKTKKKEKILTRAVHIARGACMPRGLNNKDTVFMRHNNIASTVRSY